MRPDETISDKHSCGRHISDLPPEVLDLVASLVGDSDRPAMRLSCTRLRQASDRTVRVVRLKLPWTEGSPRRYDAVTSVHAHIWSDDGEHLRLALALLPSAERVVVMAWQERFHERHASAIRDSGTVRTLKLVGRVRTEAIARLPARLARLDARLAVTDAGPRADWSALGALVGLESLRLPVDCASVTGEVRRLTRLTELTAVSTTPDALPLLPPSLRALSLQQSLLPDLGFLEAVSGLESLNLSHTYGPADYGAVAALTRLRRLELSRCRIEPPVATRLMLSLRELTYVDIEMNRLKGWLAPPDFPPGLETVLLSYCEVPREVAKKLSVLQRVRTVEAYRTGLTATDFRPLDETVVRT